MNTNLITVSQTTGDEFVKMSNALFALESMLNFCNKNDHQVPCAPDIIGVVASWLDEMTRTVFYTPQPKVD